MSNAVSKAAKNIYYYVDYGNSNPKQTSEKPCTAYSKIMSRNKNCFKGSLQLGNMEGWMVFSCQPIVSAIDESGVRGQH